MLNTSRLTLTCPRVGLSAACSGIFPSVCRVISGHLRQPDPTGFACRCALKRPACGMIYLTPPMPTKRKLTSLPQRDATLIEPMECLSVSKLPEGAQWLWEILCGPPHKNSSVASGVMWHQGYGFGYGCTRTVPDAT